MGAAGESGDDRRGVLGGGALALARRVEAFRRWLAAECVMVFPEPAGILHGTAILEGVAAAPRWKRGRLRRPPAAPQRRRGGGARLPRRRRPRRRRAVPGALQLDLRRGSGGLVAGAAPADRRRLTRRDPEGGSHAPSRPDPRCRRRGDRRRLRHRPRRRHPLRRRRGCGSASPISAPSGWRARRRRSPRPPPRRDGGDDDGDRRRPGRGPARGWRRPSPSASAAPTS